MYRSLMVSDSHSTLNPSVYSHIPRVNSTPVLPSSRTSPATDRTNSGGSFMFDSSDPTEEDCQVWQNCYSISYIRTINRTVIPGPTLDQIVVTVTCYWSVHRLVTFSPNTVNQPIISLFQMILDSHIESTIDKFKDEQVTYHRPITQESYETYSQPSPSLLNNMRRQLELMHGPKFTGNISNGMLVI